MVGVVSTRHRNSLSPRDNVIYGTFSALSALGLHNRSSGICHSTRSPGDYYVLFPLTSELTRLLFAKRRKGNLLSCSTFFVGITATYL